jgi:hypothetical protein
MIRVFIGYDRREDAAFSVLAHSIQRLASEPVSITPVMLSQLRGVYRRDVNPLQSTEFSFSRFLTPWLCGFEGWAIFMDNDMLVRDDIAGLWRLRDERYAVQVVKHNHVPKEDVKFLGRTQTKYEKKNWSSVMLMNCARCTALTPEYVNAASGLELHQFKWLEGDHLIGELPHRWNHLVDYDPYDPAAALVHFTSGGPYFEEYRGCDYAQDWLAEKQLMLHVEQRARAKAAS